MADLDQLTRDFSHDPVPDENAVSGFRVAMVIIGFTITLPIFIAGSQIGLALGLRQSANAFLIGGAILALVGGITSYIGSKTRLSTYMIIQFSFGRLGGRAVNAIIAITLFGWYGVTAYLFGTASENAFADLYALHFGVTFFTIVGCVLMILTTIWGFKALDKLSVFAVPLMMTLLGTAVFFALKKLSFSEILLVQGSGMSAGKSVSVVVGSFIVGATILPDLCRYARRTWEGVAAAGISLGIVFPAVFFSAMIPSLATGEKDLILIMMGLGIGLPALVLIIFATWSTNSHNLYATSLTLSSIFPRYRKWKITIVAGVIGTILAALGIMDYFISFLLFLGITIPPIAGIYVADFFLLRHQKYDVSELAVRPDWNWIAFAAWITSSLIGIATVEGVFTLTSIPACDSMMAAFVLYLAGSRCSLDNPRLFYSNE
jgi:cytosine permease